MEMRGRNRGLIGLAALLLTIFLAYLATSTLFPHTHSLNGEVLTHSHPYNGTPENPEHSHSQAQLQLIDSLSKYVAIAQCSTLEINPILILCGIVVVTTAAGSSCGTCSYSLRAPPVIMNA